MNITVPAFSAKDLVSALAKQTKGTLTEDCQREYLTFSEDFGEGTIVAHQVGNGLQALIIEGELKQPLVIEWGVFDKVPPLSFYVLAEGGFTQQRVDDETENLEMEPLQSAIYSGLADQRVIWHLPEAKPLLFMAILLDKTPFFEDIDCKTLEVPKELLDVIEDLDGAEYLLFDDIFHLPVIKAVQDIAKQEEIGLLHSTLAVSKIYEILFLVLREYQLEQSNEKRSSRRPTYKLNLIRNAESILVSRLQDPPTIPELARIVGMNQQSLKKRFKEVFGQTINQYVNARRLEQAEMLLRTGNLTLQEMAMEVGYCNASYFSRRFKEKYGVPPRQYADRHAVSPQT